MPFTKVDPSVLENLRQYDSATVQNAAILVRGYIPEGQDYSGPDLHHLTTEGETVVGYAMTSTWMPLHEPLRRTADRDAFYDSIADVGAPVIVVLQDIDIPPRRGAIIGDGMAYMMRAMGAVGAVTDGNARDIPGIEKAGLRLWATGRVPGHGPFNLVTCGEPVTVANLRIFQGDILVCDGDGVTRVPADIAAKVVEKCAEVREKESKIHRYFSAKDFSVEKWRRERSR
jgi:regulator of RNase E activity RraA